VAANTRVDFTADPADTYSDLTGVTFSYTNVPDDLRTLDATHYLVSTHGVLDASFGATLSVVENAATRRILEPAVQDVIGVFDTLAFRSADHHVLIWGANATEYTLDMTDVLLPDIEANSSSYDVDTHKVSWTEGTAVAQPDVTTVELDVSRPLSNESFLRWHWRIAAPYTAGEVKFPTLPVDTWTPVANDDTSTSDLLSAKVPGGYDVIRAHILDVQDRGDATSFVAGPTGRVVTVGEVLGELQRGRLASHRKRAPAGSPAAGRLLRAPTGSPAAGKTTRASVTSRATGKLTLAPTTSRATARATRAPTASPATSRMLSRGHLRKAAR
jgi:hypothetical protein